MMNTSTTQDERLKWILGVVEHYVPQKFLVKTGERLTIHMLRRELKSSLWPTLASLDEEKLQRIGSYGTDKTNDCRWSEFWTMTPLARAGLDVLGGKSARELLVEVAFTVIVGFAWDIRHQEDYRRSYGKEVAMRRQYMLE